MSGFVVVCQTDGTPVDGELLASLTVSLAEVGPDEQRVWRAGAVGMGHALLRTTWESAGEVQPLTLGHDVWLVADARVDGREELWRRLALPAPARLADTADSALILHAYLKWGEACVEHLLGDYAFVIWDRRTRRLFGARDPFGVRSLYHTRVGESWVFSNRLEGVRRHPGVSDRLNPQAVVDFLLFDGNQELDTTCFAAVAKLPPAHTFTLANGRFTRRRTWRMPEPELLRFRRDEEYLERFRGLLQQAAGDRLRTDRAAVWFSGGLDSTNLTAAALEAGRQRGRPVELQAVTAVYDRLIPDTERHFAGTAATALGLPVEFVAADDVPLYEAWDQPEGWTPEPRAGGLGGISRRTYTRAARGGRVVLYGEGADEILPAWTVGQLHRHLRPGELWRSVAGSIFRHRRMPPWGTGLAAAWRHRRGAGAGTAPPLPEWLAPSVRARADICERFAAWHDPDRNRAEGRCASRFYPALWANLLEECADEGGRAQVDVVLPYLDLRLLDFALRVPPFPWATDKYLLRRLGEGRLPRAILQRPKTGVAGDPRGVRLPDAGAWRELSARVPWAPELEDYVARDAFQAAVAGGPRGARPVWETLRPFSLLAWMQNGRNLARGGPAVAAAGAPRNSGG